jgi:ribosomal protein S18 acetylase RimI-like enzyme
MAEIFYRTAERADAAAIAELHVASWRDAYRSIMDPRFLSGPVEEDRLSLWADRLGNPPPNLIVETARGANREVIGFVAAYRNADPDWGSLVDNLHVRPDMRGRKIGEHLLRSMAHTLARQGADRGLHLWVFEENEAGLRFYRRLGGQVVERDTSRTPAADGKVVLRVHWPSLSALG